MNIDPLPHIISSQLDFTQNTDMQAICKSTNMHSETQRKGILTKPYQNQTERAAKRVQDYEAAQPLC